VLPFEEVEDVELDEMWSFVFSKENQRWLWLALDHQTGRILAHTFGGGGVKTMFSALFR